METVSVGDQEPTASEKDTNLLQDLFRTARLIRLINIDIDLFISSDINLCNKQQYRGVIHSNIDLCNKQ